MERLELEWDQPISDERKGLLGALIAITINGYESMDQYSRGFAAQLGVHELRPADVFEIRALLAQAHVVLRSLDAKSYQDFYSETIMNMRYGRPFAYFVQPFMKHGVPFDSFVSHAALMWAILGRPITGSDEKGAIIFACPAYRLAFLVQRFEKLGPPDHRTAQECFDEWDAALGCISVRNGLESVLRANTRALNHYKKMGKKFRHPEALTIMFSNFRKAQRRAVKKFLESPEDYIESDRYHTSLQYFPWPPIRIEMEGFALSRQEVQRYLDAWGSIAAPGAIEHDQCDTILIRSLDDSFDMAACSNAAEILASADYCFQMRGRADEELVAANRKLSQDSAIRRFNVF